MAPEKSKEQRISWEDLGFSSEQAAGLLAEAEEQDSVAKRKRNAGRDRNYNNPIPPVGRRRLAVEQNDQEEPE